VRELHTNAIKDFNFNWGTITGSRPGTVRVESVRAVAKQRRRSSKK